MNSISPLQNIHSYEELLAERKRLEELIRYQKTIIQVDIDQLKDELKEEMRPAVEAANFVKKITTKETRNETMISMGSNLVVDLIIRRLFAKSHFLIQMAVPALLKNYTSHVVFNLMKGVAQKRQSARPSVPMEY
jgi:hypothetical protein